MACKNRLSGILVRGLIRSGNAVRTSTQGLMTAFECLVESLWRPLKAWTKTFLQHFKCLLWEHFRVLSKASKGTFKTPVKASAMPLQPFL